MCSVGLLISLLLEGFVFASSYVLLFVPLLYFENRQQCVAYGTVMTVVMTLWSCALYFFRVVRPIQHLNRSIRQAENVFKGLAQTPAPSLPEGFFLHSSSPKSTTCVCDDLLEERHRLENALHGLHLDSRPSSHFVQDQRCAVANLLAALLLWQQSLIDLTQMKLKEAERARAGSCRQRCVSRQEGVNGNGPDHDRPGERRKSAQFMLHPRSNETAFNLETRAASAPEEPEMPLSSEPPYGPLFTPLATAAVDFEGAMTTPAAQKPNPNSLLAAVRHVDPAARLGADPNEMQLELVNAPLPQVQEKESAQAKDDVPRKKTVDAKITMLSPEYLIEQQSRRDTAMAAAVNAKPISLAPPQGESIVAAARNDAQRALENKDRCLPRLRRGDRFATDNNNVFFYLLVKHLQTPATTIGFEACFSSTEDDRFRAENFTRAPGERKTWRFSEAMPFEGFALTANGRRVSLSGAQKLLAGFRSCEVEADDDVETASGRSAALQQRPALVGKESASHGDARERAFILSWAALPEVPIRLTMLTVNLAPGESCTLPVLECLINDVFCILTSAVLTVELVSGESRPERGVSVELHGVSIEDTSEVDQIAPAAVEPGEQLGFGMPVSQTIKL
ncbi:uncharacterized protein Tco025E_02527 [Trypanosoma conorhini]|uniref:Transmembrane protein n=1 Tax=Trypanosoma conorhini TaxID=83891 RepID=A0A422Q3B6_9TRYP|nr:uncharacterized protein Tco025E_02527 [Trypanosoma conorhini]RNF24464.1 hypothetical protein Tco025E_02527 [Trypanosoma conorhini]